MSLKSISPRSILDKATSGNGRLPKFNVSPPSGQRRSQLEFVKSRAWSLMKNLPLDPDVADTAPTEQILTAYDHEHVVTYTRLLQADSEGADWREVARIVYRPAEGACKSRR